MQRVDDELTKRVLRALQQPELLSVHYDRVGLASSRQKAELEVALPIPLLRARSHWFEVTEKHVWRHVYQSRLEFVCTASHETLHILSAHEDELGNYVIPELELAADYRLPSEEVGRRALDIVIPHVSKVRHMRRHIQPAY